MLYFALLLLLWLASYASTPTPPAATWAKHAVLLIAKVMPGGSGSAFTPVSVAREGGTLTVSYKFTQPAPASFTVIS